MVRRVVRNLAAISCLGLVAACGSLPGSHSDTSESRSDAAPSIETVATLDDPKAYEGRSTASLGDTSIDPVVDDPKPDLPVTVTDAQGTKVTIKDTDRILALDIYGSLSQTVFELGLGDNVIGRDTSTAFDEAADLPLVTQNGHDLNAEAILDLSPSVIITDTSLGPWDVMMQMRDAGIPVVVVDSHRGIDNVRSLTMEVARALGVPQAGRKLAERTATDIKHTVSAITDAAPSNVQSKLRMVFLYVRGQAGIYYMFGKNSGADSLIDALGGYDVSREINWSGMKPVTDEAIVAAQPDVILMMTKGLDSVDGVDGLLEQLPAIANTPAGQKRRIVDMDDSQILSYGPRTADVLNALAVAVYAPESES